MNAASTSVRESPLRLAFLVIAALALLHGTALGAHAEDAAPLPFVSPIFGDNMVLQRGKPNAIWGWTQPGDVVRVEIGENSATATAGADGRWQASVQPPMRGVFRLKGRPNLEQSCL